jgi:lipoprotein-anchoring transpeptidase ErfK/SrfK
MRVPHSLWAALAAVVLPARLGALSAPAPDPGVLIEIDLGRYSLAARDLSADTPGPEMRIAVGSPAHPTPIGEYHPRRVVRNPGWLPGPVARASGAHERPPSSDGPLCVGKIPLEAGALQIHGGADALELGKPISLGCVSLRDDNWLELVDWLRTRASLAPERAAPEGDFVSEFRRPIRVVVR